ncbi:hypothetical protein HID58_068191 [Brassica napus]|uniref:Malectin domain-containing protein n=1 Tax=Brassica napus TaxID=3708 RepID=A0ABQ7ZKQ9_BRANA|nr:hypothetical protein HID58_068191 [Brassica napus]
MKFYDADADTSDRPIFYDSRNGWVSSNTGKFLDDERSPNEVTLWANTSELSIADPSLYTHARLSAISLTYYAFCLGQGNYTVNLHFAEIVFTGNQTFSSLGRRFFDIYVQNSFHLRKLALEVVVEALLARWLVLWLLRRCFLCF